ncbi:hypothetical protein [Sphingobium indicum]|uniref:hypothetical protein n=1 Tax=Sphingobium indicum TaxID=332055 RepID=UPI00131419D7|nr:hypothetical protein [Sphingobium indicum]NYI24216.1 hypothetical protein [Sphingobium indicum]
MQAIKAVFADKAVIRSSKRGRPKLPFIHGVLSVILTDCRHRRAMARLKRSEEG